MANRIRELRLARGLTLEQVGAKAETSPQQIQRLEKGERRLTDDWMRRVAPALGVAPATLLADTLPDADRVAQNIEEVVLLRLWRVLDPSEKRWIAALAREKGIETLVDKPKKRPA
ncbi:MAG: helix-turn-helix transcriptional regulator [Proteobacteria bacterium]|nr:helix-turn-helix transcriptional regulator [Pseudomonadota bacterium]